ncbi:hypothetical protein KCU65_g5656, partial [Aureobasidium melanogenum]
MRLIIFIFVSTSLALLIPRCAEGDHTSSSINARDLNASPVAPAAHKVAKAKAPAKKHKTTSTMTTSTTTTSAMTTSTTTTSAMTTSTTTAMTTPLATRAVATDSDELSISTCIPQSICVDAINSCGMRYGGCYDQNYCDGNTSPYPIPTCPTMVTVKREAAPPIITPA